jgi:membrane-bound serine protease (ClpP class)
MISNRKLSVYATLLLTFVLFVSAEDSLNVQQQPAQSSQVLVYEIPIMNEIDPRMWRTVKRGFEEAEKLNAKYILIHMNTYGGMVDAADSIRTKILNSKIPVLVWVDNNAASAGALISIACDSIYMRKGANIGAATVVNQTGQAMPDKYQSYMRSTMRSTAEAHGKDTLISGNDTIIKWRRDPTIAEAMVDPRIYIPGVIDTGKVITFTTEEAMRNGYCEGEANSIKEVMQKAGIQNYEIKEYKVTGLEKFILFLINPLIQGILIMIIVGGIYFELQTPGIGFPIAASITAAMLYFAPLYLEGLAQNWEIMLFIGGVVLIAIEIFAIPGFGVAGFTGIALLIAGLTLSMVDNVVFEFDALTALNAILKAFFIVVTSLLLSLLFSIMLSKQLFAGRRIRGLALDTIQDLAEGYVGVDMMQKTLVGKTGVAQTILRPSGKVIVDDEIYDAKSLTGWIDKGIAVKILRYEAGQLYVSKVEE